MEAVERAKTLLGVVVISACITAVSYISIDVYQRYEAKQHEIYARVKADIEAQEVPKKREEFTVRVEMGATVMTKVWFAKDMKNPIILQMLVTSGVCKTSKQANEEAMAQIKKPASSIHITCKKITELNQ